MNYKIDWDNWVEISFQEYQEMNIKETLLILDRGRERYWKLKKGVDD